MITALDRSLPARDLYGKDERDVYRNVIGDLESVIPFFTEIYCKAYRNVEFYANNQWNARERMAFARQLRIAYEWNNIAPQIDNMLGQQISTRMDVKAEAVERGDEAAVATMNRLIKWYEQINRINQVESEVFKHGLLQGAGISQNRWQVKDFLYGFPSIERVPMYQMLWDIGHTSISMEDCRWMSRVIPLRKAEAIEILPQYREAIDEAGMRHDTSLYHIYYDALRPLHQNQQYAYYNISNEARQYVYLILHYEKILRNQFIVIDGVMGNDEQIFDTAKEAIDYADGLEASYIAAGKAPYSLEGDRLVQVALSSEDAFLQTVCVGNRVVERSVVDMPSFPFQVFFCNFVDGKFWSHVDGLIGPQRFMNRMVSEWDNQVTRSNKNAWLVNRNMLDGINMDQLARIRSSPNVNIPVKNLEAAIKDLENPHTANDFPVLTARAEQFMVQKGGGNNIMGLSENAAESGKAVRSRQAAAGMQRVPLYEGLRMWRADATENAMWQMKTFLPLDEIRRIIGSDPDVADVVAEDDVLLDTLRETRTNIVVTSTPDTELRREQLRADMAELFQSMQGQVPWQVTVPTMIELSDVPEAIKQKILDNIEWYNKYQEQQIQQMQQQKIAERSKNQVTGEIERDTLREQLKTGQTPSQEQVLQNLS